MPTGPDRCSGRLRKPTGAGRSRSNTTCSTELRHAASSRQWAIRWRELASPEQAAKRIRKLDAEMMKLARNLEFEQAARLRDEIHKLRQAAFGVPDKLVG
jgi:excinuclease UvrABC helicase subunit UvrB